MMKSTILFCLALFATIFASAQNPSSHELELNFLQLTSTPAGIQIKQSLFLQPMRGLTYNHKIGGFYLRVGTVAWVYESIPGHVEASLTDGLFNLGKYKGAQVNIGAEKRFGHNKFQPTLGVGIFAQKGSYKKESISETGGFTKYNLDHQGLGIYATMGLRYTLSRRFFIGLLASVNVSFYDIKTTFDSNRVLPQWILFPVEGTGVRVLPLPLGSLSMGISL